MKDSHLTRRPMEGYIDKLIDVLVLLMWRPRTLRALIEHTEYKSDTVRHYVNRAHEAGLVYIERYDMTTGRPREVFALQDEPFAKTDAPRPE